MGVFLYLEKQQNMLKNEGLDPSSGLGHQALCPRSCLSELMELAWLCELTFRFVE